MSGVLCLKWNNHTTTFVQSLDSFRLKESYCDATIACCGRYYPIHKFVLGTCSDYFEEIFSRAPCKHPFIVLKDISNVQLEALLNYMYKGEVNILQKNLPDLIRAAESLRVKGLIVSNERKLDREEFEENHSSLDSIPIYEEKSHVSKSTQSRLEGDKREEIQAEEPILEEEICQNTNLDSLEAEKSLINSTEESATDGPYSQEDIDINSKNACGYVKSEPEELEQNILKSKIEDEEPAQNFGSLLSPNFYSEKEDFKENEEIANGFDGFAMPQCSTWNDSLPDANSLQKEFLPASWMQSSDYDSFSLDPLHYLTINGDATPPTKPLDAPHSLNAKSKEKNFRLKRTSPSGSKYQCAECSFRTNDKSAFRLHEMRKHTGEKPFACTVCAYRCTTKDMLKIHTRKHTGERPFSCPYCTCQMAVKSSLKRHIMLKHIQPRKPKSYSSSISDTLITKGTVKAFKCSFCSYESQMKSNLKLHCMRIHTGEKPIACGICPYRTTTKPQLEKHMRKHTGEKPFTCTFCTYKAAQKHSLLRHMSLHLK